MVGGPRWLEGRAGWRTALIEWLRAGCKACAGRWRHRVTGGVEVPS